MPAETSVLAPRRERYELAQTIGRIAARSRKAIELRVLQYGVTRERLRAAPRSTRLGRAARVRPRRP